MKKNKANHVTMNDIAKAAGVSKSAVSKALNDKSDISKELKKHIFKICEKMGYQINFRIQDLVKERITGMTHSIALVMVNVNFSDTAYAKIIDGIATGVKENNLRLLLEKIDGSEESIYDLPPVLRDERVDGFIVSGVINKSLINVFNKLNIPYVVLGTYENTLLKNCMSILPDMKYGIEEIIKKLVKIDKKRIAFYTANLNSHLSKQWFKFTCKALTKFNLGFNEELLYLRKPNAYTIYEVMKPVFEKRELPFDALISINYSNALLVSHLIHSHSKKYNTKPIALATSNIFNKDMLPVPTIYYDNKFSDIAYCGVVSLLDIIYERSKASGKIFIKPNVYQNLSIPNS